MTKAYPTIVALSSGAGRAGVAVVRVSGERVRFAVETIAGSVPEARKAAYRALRDPEGAVIDHGLVLFFPAPASFTGEDVAEFHIHGSRAVLSRLLSVLTALPGLRLAEPGEFTRRAFEAGKLDLAVVEGLADLIDSETEWQRKQALRQMEGALGQAAAAWRSGLIEAMMLLEAEIDFSDEGDVSGPLIVEAVARAQGVLGSLQVALGSFSAGERVREGFVVVLAGPPNAGKSSLLNALARRDVAIVSPIAGTTRDAIEVRLDLGGIPVLLVDTAGLRDSVDEIEAEGVRRARQKAAQADLVLRLRPPDSVPEREESGATEISVATKLDLGGRARPGEIGVSAMTGVGLPELIELIASRLGKLGQTEPALVTRERQRVALADAAAAIERAALLSHDHPELMAEELRLAVRGLERLIGKVDVEDVLDSLFSGFCIGK
ncbi:tRNA modification GTPase [Bosea sp. CRIB-10]|uniref:tRNA uridine-5-carboxymethylaminomethyl(34) synthesis GTPase MnmE n=1 Tax=Bosea sp. CRIB-10 TaxID=378404 RepID=UPI0008F1F828|nr:tRNA uridine-5-carboxymethylaminomethyl(34) synthesis GTPase MnmE [Bosea sp. CRIB-10]SFD60695.1 tRNA modification GTPase [Bosea sp. CRIB-10]